MVMATEGAASYRAGWQSIRVLVVDGNYARKINEAVRATEEPYLLFGADDLRFRPDWFEVAKRRLVGHFGVVATNDLANKRNQYGLLATHPLVARWYAEMETIDGSPGPLYEGYPHEYVDREFSEVARFRGAFVHEPLSVVEHLHPMVGKAPMDQLYALQKQRMRVGKKIYAERRQMWT